MTVSDEQKMAWAHEARTNAGRTAITRDVESAPLRLLKSMGLVRGRVLDFGCGKGRDALENGYDKYDLYHYPRKPRRKYDTVLCIYVLNVLMPDDREQVLADIRSYLKKGGVAYIAVRRDVKKQGFRGKGENRTYQWNATLAPKKHGVDTVAHKKGKFRIYKITRT